MSDVKKVEVTMNWDNFKKVVLKVPEAWTKAQIDKALVKKYGIYDIKEWRELTE
jgi:hypothetical protein